MYGDVGGAAADGLSDGDMLIKLLGVVSLNDSNVFDITA